MNWISREDKENHGNCRKAAVSGNGYNIPVIAMALTLEKIKKSVKPYTMKLKAAKGAF